MNRQDAPARHTRVPRWKVLSFTFSAVAMLATCVAVRYFWGTSPASAQAPAKFRPASAPASTPAASGTRPAAGTTASGAAAKGSPAKGTTAGTGAGGAPATSEEEGKMAIMAMVNGEQITRQDLARECLLRYGNDVLETIVNKHLILGACKAQGIVVTQDEVGEEIKNMAAKFGLSADRWLNLLEEQRNVNPQQYANDIIWPTLALRKLSADKIQVTADEVRRGMESEFGPRVRVRIITAGKQAKAEQLRAKAAADPESFGELAKEFSEDQVSASARGMIPPIRKHVGDPLVEKTAFALKEGEVSKVIPVAGQFLVMKCEKQEGPVYVDPRQKQVAEERLIDQLGDKKLRAAGEELFKRLQTESKVVNVLNDEKLKKQHPGVAATINGGQITVRQLSEECLTRHGLSVLDGEINRVLLKQELAKRKLTVSREDLDDEIVRAARTYGFERNGQVDVNGWLRKVTEEEGATVELYMKDAVWPTVALKNLVGNNIQVSKEDLDKAYQANYGERVEVLAIVLSSQRQATTVWDMARNDPTDEFFSKLAAQYSVEPASKANGGRVPPVQRHGGQPKLEEEAFKLRAGELSSIIALGDKFIIMRCLGRTKPVAVKRNEVEAELRADLLEKKQRMEMGKLFDSVKENAKVDNFLAGTTQSPKAPSTARNPKTSSLVTPPAGVAPANYNQSGASGVAPRTATRPAPK